MSIIGPIINSDHPDDNHENTEEMVIMVSQTAVKALMQWERVFSRIMTVRFNSKGMSYIPNATRPQTTQNKRRKIPTDEFKQ